MHDHGKHARFQRQIRDRVGQSENPQGVIFRGNGKVEPFVDALKGAGLLVAVPA